MCVEIAGQWRVDVLSGRGSLMQRIVRYAGSCRSRHVVCRLDDLIVVVVVDVSVVVWWCWCAFLLRLVLPTFCG
jgi:hypothetical protein